MSSNVERFGAMLSNRMKQTSSAAVPTTIELGRVNENMSITPDHLRVPIPKGEYMVNLMLTGSFTTASTGHTHGGADHSHGGGEHSHALPSSFRGLRPGDRILILWSGNEPIVIAILVSS